MSFGTVGMVTEVMKTPSSYDYSNYMVIVLLLYVQTVSLHKPAPPNKRVPPTQQLFCHTHETVRSHQTSLDSSKALQHASFETEVFISDGLHIIASGI